MEDFEKNENQDIDTPNEPAEAASEDMALEAPAEKLPVVEEPKIIYHWNYDATVDAEVEKRKNRGSRGAVIYATVISVAFLICFAALVLALLFDSTFINRGDGQSASTPNETVVKVEERVVYVKEYDSESGVLTTQEIYDKCLPSTVSIIVNAGTTSQGTGSGFFVTEDGYIATANHVVDGAASIKVVMSNGEMYDAEVIDGNEYTDIAVIKINKKNCTPIAIGSSDALLVGDDVVAIGTPAAIDFAGSLVKGSVSYKNRMLKVYNAAGTAVEKKMRLIQTDALVNPGNSGCPLINDKGEFVGIITMKLNSSYYEAMCFAIPSDAAMPIINAMIKGENYEALLGKISVKPAALGISGENEELPEVNVYGVKVTAFTSAEYDISKKLQLGDVITKLDGISVTSIPDIRLILDKKLPGESIVITFYRNGQYQNATVVLGT